MATSTASARKNHGHVRPGEELETRSSGHRGDEVGETRAQARLERFAMTVSQSQALRSIWMEGMV